MKAEALHFGSKNKIECIKITLSKTYLLLAFEMLPVSEKEKIEIIRRINTNIKEGLWIKR